MCAFYKLGCFCQSIVVPPTCRYDESLWRRLDFGGRILKGGVLGNTILDRGVEFLRLASAEVCEKYSYHVFSFRLSSKIGQYKLFVCITG